MVCRDTSLTLKAAQSAINHLIGQYLSVHISPYKMEPIDDEKSTHQKVVDVKGKSIVTVRSYFS